MSPCNCDSLDIAMLLKQKNNLLPNNKSKKFKMEDYVSLSTRIRGVLGNKKI